MPHERAATSFSVNTVRAAEAIARGLAVVSLLAVTTACGVDEPGGAGAREPAVTFLEPDDVRREARAAIVLRAAGPGDLRHAAAGRTDACRAGSETRGAAARVEPRHVSVAGTGGSPSRRACTAAGARDDRSDSEAYGAATVAAGVEPLEMRGRGLARVRR